MRAIGIVLGFTLLASQVAAQEATKSLAVEMRCNDFRKLIIKQALEEEEELPKLIAVVKSHSAFCKFYGETTLPRMTRHQTEIEEFRELDCGKGRLEPLITKLRINLHEMRTLFQAECTS